MYKKQGLCKGLGWRSDEFKRGKGMKNKRKKKKRLAKEQELFAKRKKEWEEAQLLEQYSEKWD